jgi:hypothetical protein
MGRLVPLFRQLYQETVSDLQMEIKAALVDLSRRSGLEVLTSHIIFRKLLFKGLLLNYCLGITAVRIVVRCTPEGIKLDQLSHPEGIKANLIYLIGSITALSLTFPLDTLSYAYL